MRVVFVIGPAGSGKSTFIKNNFPDAIVVDLWDYQEDCYSMQDIIDSYNNAEEALKEAIKENLNTDNTVVLEHTLLKQIRRPQYIDAVKSLTDTPIEVFAMNPSQEEYKKRCNSSKKPFYKDYLEIYELPEVEEGFGSVTIVKE
jgi:predicted kinase